MLQFKLGVDEHDVSPQMWFALGVAAEIHWKMFERPMVITALRDGEHMPSSLHKKGQAADLRSNDSSPLVVQAWVAQIRERLFLLGYDVVNETTPAHVHIEYDPTAGRVFPAVPMTEKSATSAAVQV